MKKKRYALILILAVLFAISVSILLINKIIKINPFFAGRYELRGIDVSHYQGVIDWEKLAGQELDFAFIKATEGSSYLDECFYDNWQAAGKTDLYIGAYHFFSFDSEGKNQAEFFISTVGNLEGKLSPVVDVEFYGDKAYNPPEKEAVVTQLGEMLSALEEHYQVKPIIYTTYTVYNQYIKGDFQEYPLWIRNVYYPPDVTLRGAWNFWQYMDTAVLEGYSGTEKYIDMNVFRGTKEELEMLLVQRNEKGTVQEVEEAEETTDIINSDEWSSCYRAYKSVLADWTLIEKYGDFSYYTFYFGDNYGYDSYFLFDVDKNGIPELFLCSESMCITTVLTYEQKLCWLVSDDIYGINEETGELIVLGHWHGSGGSGSEHECTGWKISGDKAENSMYIDFYDFSENGDFIPQEGDESFYVIYDVKTESYEHTTNGAKYEELYAVHVKPCALIEDYQLYDLSDLSGLDRAWKESCGDKPFYQYYDEESGELQMELYYDFQTGRGFGTRYYPETEGMPDGFAIGGIEEGETVCGAIWERINTDPYETLAFGGRDASQYHEIENYEEEIEYTSDGKIAHYKSLGNITYLEDAENTDTIVEIDFLYRNDGSLKERKYRHNGFVFETTCSVMDSFYDRQQRLLYEDCYITHGSLDYYYIYNGEEQIPTYCLILDHNLDLLCPELLIMQSYFGT